MPLGWHEEEDEGRKKEEVEIRHFGRHRCNSGRKKKFSFAVYNAIVLSAYICGSIFLFFA